MIHVVLCKSYETNVVVMQLFLFFSPRNLQTMHVGVIGERSKIHLRREIWNPSQKIEIDEKVHLSHIHSNIALHWGIVHEETMHVGQYSAIFKLTHANVIYDILESLIFCYRNFYWNGCLCSQENYIEDFGSFVAKKCNVIYPKRRGVLSNTKKQGIEGTDFLSLNHLLRNKLAKL